MNSQQRFDRAVVGLVHDLGVTVLMAEHRLERVIQYADRVVRVHRDGTVESGDTATMMATSDLAPPVVGLARLLGWFPPPLSVRDARRSAGAVRERLAGVVAERRAPVAASAAVTLEARSLVVHRGRSPVIRSIDLSLGAGVTALMGRNGSGKSTLMWALQGSLSPTRGSVRIGGSDPSALGPAEARGLVTLVPQSPADLLYLTSVADECNRADTEAAAAPGTCAAWLERLVEQVDETANPRDLSEGQRLALALAVQLTPAPAVVLLDEPTRGLDHLAKARLGEALAGLAGNGHPVLVATHDVEFVAEWANRVVVLAEGEVVADGPSAEVVVASAAWAPQVAKVLHPQPWLTVAEVASALGRNAPPLGDQTTERGLS